MQKENLEKKAKNSEWGRQKKETCKKRKKGIKGKICKVRHKRQKMQSKKRKTSGSFEHDL